MAKTYKLIELVGTSKQGYEEAIKNAIEEAKKTLTGLSWFEVVELRGGIKDNEVEYQAKLKVAFEVKRED